MANKINISDCWVPLSTTCKVFTLKGHIMLKQVDEINDSRSGDWNEELIRDFFWPIDVNSILSIPLVQNGLEDLVAWRYNENNLFSV